MQASRRARVVEARSHTLGQVPGGLPPPTAGAESARISALHYDADQAESHPDLTPAEARALVDRPGVTWVEVDGLHDTATVGALGQAFGLHPLVVEDLASPIQRPKLEIYDGDDSAQVIVVARPVLPTALDPGLAYGDGDPSTQGHVIEQLGLVLGPGWVLSVGSGCTDLLAPIRDRIERGGGHVRQRGADYLLYALLDVVVDTVFSTLERIGDATETLEEQALEDPSPAVQRSITDLRREIVVLRRAVWPLREVLAALQREDVPYVQPSTHPYLRDAYDHLVQAVEILEALREVLGSLFDLYLSALSTRQNEVMRVLTVVGTIFLPLGFLTGLYGMNFDVMPELHWRGGYFVLLSVMAALATGTLAYFRRKGWL